MNRLFLVGHPHQVSLVTRGIDRLIRRQGKAGCIAGADLRIVAQRAEWRGDDALRNAFVRNAGHVVGLHAFFALCDEEILAAQLNTGGATAGMAAAGLERAAIFLMCLEPVRVGVLVQVAADDGLRFVPLGDLHRIDPTVATNPGVVADEVDEIGSVHQQLRHDGIVVAVLGEVAVLAHLRFCLTHRVRKVRVECLG